VVVHNFSYGFLNLGFVYLTSYLGCFLGLQCTARARAMNGAGRARWLLLAAVSIGATAPNGDRDPEPPSPTQVYRTLGSRTA
jgi:hypothetical protein